MAVDGSCVFLATYVKLFICNSNETSLDVITLCVYNLMLAKHLHVIWLNIYYVTKLTVVYDIGEGRG